MSKSKILVIDDDVDLGTLLQRYLKRQGFDSETVHSAKSGLENIRESVPDAILADYRLPDMDGLHLIKKIRTIDAKVPIIIITGYSDVKQAIQCMKAGAYDYVTKPIQPEEIVHLINKAKSTTTAPVQESSTPNKTQQTEAKPIGYINGKSEVAKQINKLMKLVGPTDMTVLILGETGTGKEVAAKQIHECSKRKKKPFVAIDCGALPANLAASELFGHIKGAFTGALHDHKGCFERAHGGTLFLDEVGNLSYENQVRLLRVLQEGQIQRLGDEKTIKVDVRVVAATNEDLIKAVGAGSFREDLYHRLNEFKIEIPALRNRNIDIPLFANYFLEKSNLELEKEVSEIDENVINFLNQYSWPGNLRELRNVMKRAVLLAGSGKIKEDHIPYELKSESPIASNDINIQTLDLKTVVANAEVNAIERALSECSYNKSKAARLLGVDRKTLYNKLEQYNIKA
tara:strand:+ start:1016 stop:2389 length:1374 start_codon:yes stop_codon:yes gene_type:complete